MRSSIVILSVHKLHTKNRYFFTSPMNQTVNHPREREMKNKEQENKSFRVRMIERESRVRMCLCVCAVFRSSKRRLNGKL